MKKNILLLLLILPVAGFSQKNLFIGWNVPPLLPGAIDLRAEQQIGRNLAIQGGLGFRIAGRDTNQDAVLRALNRYTSLRNRAVFMSVGLRAFERSPAEYPYIAFDLVGVYYDETVVNRDRETVDVNGFKLGAALTGGFVSRLTKRLSLDIALRLGYSPPRPTEHVLNYYLPGLGYNTYGFNVFSVPGGHVEPIITLKYNLIKDKRDRIREKE